MTLDDLRVFVAVCETGNLSAVARSLSCSQSAVSQHVKRLERQTGLTLLERRPRGVVPTESGRILYQAALGGIASLDAALRRLDELRGGAAGTVKITTGGVTVRHFMADAITAFRQRHLHVMLEFHSAQSTRRCLQKLQAGGADLAWITLGAARPGVEQRPVITLPWVLVVHRDDPLAERQAIAPAELAAIRYLAHPENSASRSRLEEDFIRLGVRPSAPVSVADWDTAVLLAEVGIGHAILPDLPRLRQVAGNLVRTVPIPDLTPIVVGWAARQWDALGPLATEFAHTVAVSLGGDLGEGRSERPGGHQAGSPPLNPPRSPALEPALEPASGGLSRGEAAERWHQGGAEDADVP